MENLKSLVSTMGENLFFVIMAACVTAVIFAAAGILQRLFGHGEEMPPLRRMTVMALFAAIAVILNVFSFPVAVIAPSFYKLDFSEIPILICGFLLGPVAGVTVEFVKIMLNLLINGTNTMFIGEFANFIVGCAFVLPASILYMFMRTRKGAIVSMAAGTAAMVLAGCMLNAWLLLPWYAEHFYAARGGMDAIVAAGSKVNPVIDSVFTFVVCAVAPFNFIKAAGCSVVTFLLYKKLSKALKAVK